MVIGILIALEFDNWDKQNTNRDTENQYYLRMKAELLEDKRLLLAEIDFNQSFLVNFDNARQILASKDLSKQHQLAKYVTDLRSISDFRRSSSIYHALVNSGEIKIIKNTDTLSLFQKLERDYSYIERLENVHRDALLADVISIIINTVQLDPLAVKDEETLFSYQLNNIFFMIADLMKEKNMAYQQAMKNIDKIVATIDTTSK